ncbi:conserved exported hypothetical protein [Verrucomicrobia bacterium]|nr:conserved exported hypothetical protein [Verrucomicrobiota bacterium]
MKSLLFALVLGTLVGSGCAGKKPAPPSAEGSPPTFTPLQKLTTTSETALGRVAKVNATDRFVVLTFFPGHVPTVEERLCLYRHGAKAGEVKVSGPQIDADIVADLLSGDAEVGDEVRGQ